MEEIKRITEEQLAAIQKMNIDFTKAKISLGDLLLQQYSMMDHIRDLKVAFVEYENTIIAEYGEDAVIDLQTGIITKK